MQQVEVIRFALIWNEIIITFREEDLISDREVELLELPPNYWNIRVIRWPCFLLCNELLLALSQATELENESDRSLWLKICKSQKRFKHFNFQVSYLQSYWRICSTKLRD